MNSDPRNDDTPEAGGKDEPRRADEGGPQDPVVEADEESFPASDAPSWTPLHSGAPRERAD